MGRLGYSTGTNINTLWNHSCVYYAYSELLKMFLVLLHTCIIILPTHRLSHVTHTHHTCRQVRCLVTRDARRPRCQSRYRSNGRPEIEAAKDRGHCDVFVFWAQHVGEPQVSLLPAAVITAVSCLCASASLACASLFWNGAWATPVAFSSRFWFLGWPFFMEWVDLANPYGHI